ncbi:hypothetical protein LOK49_LG15G00620 [Camellia lanceoleosa]|uniref:Uncharacterized protein n=1 Tax=Camellia lanceoleosa TaxID=1840588 RepID=A0ACC0F2J4_9ERIC|nr:hypothetical protein LOK49_LG15G00620 [Camellia lanceoleosa]
MELRRRYAGEWTEDEMDAEEEEEEEHEQSVEVVVECGYPLPLGSEKASEEKIQFGDASHSQIPPLPLELDAKSRTVPPRDG